MLRVIFEILLIWLIVWMVLHEARLIQLEKDMAAIYRACRRQNITMRELVAVMHEAAKQNTGLVSDKPRKDKNEKDYQQKKI